jgi:hypothetical protein
MTDSKSEDKTLASEIATAFFLPPTGVKELPEGREKADALAMQEAFTNAVDYLRSRFPNEKVRKRAARIWETINQRKVNVALGPEVSSLYFAFTRSSHPSFRLGQHSAQGMIFMPHRWLDMVAADAVMQTGAVLFVGSQAVDFGDGLLVGQGQHLISHTESVERARVFEAEYLLAVLEKTPGWKPNDYQARLLTEWPEGLGSKGAWKFGVEAT